MPTYSFIDTPDSRKYILNSLSTNKNLTQWERDFIKDIKEYTEKGGFLSNPQKKVLSDLWEKY